MGKLPSQDFPQPSCINESDQICKWQSPLPPNDFIDSHPDLRSGVPVLKGTRLTIAQILTELADQHSVDKVAEAFGIDVQQICKILEMVGFSLDRKA